jgi:hypothetical protein
MEKEVQTVLKNNKNFKELQDFIHFWNSKFPLDYWWRKRYNVAFNSVVHREFCFLDQLIEYQEEKMYEKFFEDNKKKKDIYQPDRGKFLNVRKLSEKEIDDIFDRIGEEIENS